MDIYIDKALVECLKLFIYSDDNNDNEYWRNNSEEGISYRCCMSGPNPGDFGNVQSHKNK